jgi:hypothetical protein
MRNVLTSSLLAVSLTLAVGCGAPLPEEMEDVGQGELTSKLEESDNIVGNWNSGGTVIYVCPCNDTGTVTSGWGCWGYQGIAIFSNITKQGCDGNGCTYTATRQTGNGTACGLTTVTATLRVPWSGGVMNEYHGSTYARRWTR